MFPIQEKNTTDNTKKNCRSCRLKQCVRIIKIKMYTLNNNMYNIQFIQYVMLLCNVSEIKHMDVVSINKQLEN